MRSILSAVAILILATACLSTYSMAADRSSVSEDAEGFQTVTARSATSIEEPIWPTIACVILGFGSLVLVRRNIDGLKTRRDP